MVIVTKMGNKLDENGGSAGCGQRRFMPRWMLPWLSSFGGDGFSGSANAVRRSLKLKKGGKQQLTIFKLAVVEDANGDPVFLFPFCSD